MAQTWDAFCDAYTTNDIVCGKGSGVIEISSNLSPSEGFQTLLDNRVLSAPVWSEEEKKYVGFLDMRDFVSFVVFFYHSEVEGGVSFVNIMREGLKTFNTPVDGISVTYLARRHPFRPVVAGTSLKELLKTLSSTIARVPVVDENGKVTKIISQSSLVAFINKHHGDLPLTPTIAELGIGSSPVIQCPKDTPAIEAYKTLDTTNRSGIAIIDEEGKICSATSARDLKGFLSNPSVERLGLPIFEFLKTIRRESVDICAPTITVEEHDNLALVIGKLAATRVHRVFVVDNDKSYKPIKVVSVKDVIKHVISQLS